MIVLTAVFQIGQPLQAATVYWDINGSTAGASGSSAAAGTWDAGGAFWNNAAGTGTSAAWASGDIAVFSAGTNATGVSAITNSGTQSIGGLMFEEGTVNLSGGTLQLTQDAIISVASGLTSTLASDLTGAFNLTKTGAGTLDYQGNGAGLTGEVAVNGGTLKLSGNGVLTGSPMITLRNRGILTLDNSGTNLGDRLPASGLTSNGGTLNFSHNAAAGTNYSETLGALSLNAGALTINTSQAASGQSSILTTPILAARNAGGTLYVNGVGLGGSTRNQFIFTTAPALTNNLVPYIVANNGSTIRFATHTGDGTSLTPLTTGYTATQGSWSGATVNALPSVDQTVSNPRTMATLTLDSGIDLLGPTADRTLTMGTGGTGAVLQTGGTSLIASNGNSEHILAFGTNEAVFHIFGDLTIQRGTGTAPTGGNLTGSGGLTKSGPGRLTVGSSGMTGVFRLNEGIYRAVTSAAALGAGTVEFNGGGLELAADAGVNFARPTTLNTDATITIDRVTAAATAVTHTLGTLAISDQTLTVSAGPLVNSGTNFGLTFGATTFNGNSTFVVNNNAAGEGNLTLGALNDGGVSRIITKLGPGILTLGTATTNILGSSVIDVQAGTLRMSNPTAFGAAGTILLSTSASTLEPRGTGGTFANPVIVTADARIMPSRATSSGSSVTHSYGSLTIGTNNLTIAMGLNITGNGASNLTITNVTTLVGDPTLTLNNVQGTGIGVLNLAGGIDGGLTPRIITKTSTASTFGTLTIGAAAINLVAGSQFLNLAGITNLNATDALGAATIQLGDTSGARDATLRTNVATDVTIANNITVKGGNTGLMTLGNNTANNTVFSGLVTLEKDVTLTSVGGLVTFSNVIDDGVGSFVVNKTGAGTVVLAGANTYTGATNLAVGALQAVDGVGLPTASNLIFNGGVFEGNGTFTRSLGTGAGQVQWATGASGGFAAFGGPLTVTLAGAPDPLRWDVGAFVSGAGALAFGSLSADNVTTFTHNIDLNQTGTALSRTFSAVDNPNSLTDKAVLSGVLSNSGAAGGVTKTGNGVLELGALNTFTGPVTVTLGTLQFSTVTNAGGAASNLGQGTDISLGGGRLQFIGGTSQSTNRPITLTAASILDSSGTGGATMTYTGAITGTGFGLTLDGTGAGFLNGALTQTGTAADLIKTGPGTWDLNVPATIADDLIVNNGVFNINATPTFPDEFTISGAGTVINANVVLGVGDDIVINTGSTINLNAVAIFSGDDFYVRGGTVKLGVNGALTNAMDNFLISFDVASGGVLDLNGTTGSAPTDIFLGNGTLLGSIIDSVGTGSITTTNAFNLLSGTVNATLTGTNGATKTTPGTVTLFGANSFAGATTISEGTLILDYTLNNGEKLANAAAVNLVSGSLVLNGSSTAATTETIGAMPLTGSGKVVVNNGTGQTATLIMGGITHAAVGDGTVDFSVSSPSAVIQTSAVNTAGTILGGWATFGGNRFATVSGGTIQAATSVASNDVSAWAAGEHVLGSTGFTGTTGNRTIASLIFDAAATSTVTIATGARLNISSGGILVSSATGANAASITGGTLITGTGGELLVHQHNTTAEFVIGSTLFGTTSLTKSGAGMLTLTARNFHSGQTTIHEGTLRVSGGDAIGDRSLVELRAMVDSVLDLNNGTETIGGLTGGGTTGGTVAIGTGALTLNPSATQVFVGLLTGSGTLIKTGTANQELEGSSGGFTGTVIVNQGLLHLDAGAGALPNVLTYTINGPSSSLLSDQDGDDDIGRINNDAVITLNNTGGGNGLRVRNSNDQNETRVENVGTIILGAGHNVLMAETTNTAAAAATRLTATVGFTRNNQATMLARGLNLGAASGIRGLITFTVAPTGAIGGNGAATTNFSIFPYMIGDITSTGLGNSFVTLDATTGLRPLNLTTEYVMDAAGYNALSGVTDRNVRFAANPGATLTGGSKTINSLVIDSTAGAMTLTGNAADSLTLASGALLASTSTPANGTTLTGFASLLTGTTEYLVYTTNATHTLTINSALATTAASLTKSGAGTLVLGSTTNSYTGGTWFNQGLVEAGALTSLGTGALNFFGGGLRWGTGATFDISARTVTMNTGGGTLDTNGNDVTLAAAIGNGGAGGLTKAGAGNLTLNAVINYTGNTTITGGTLTYGVASTLPTTATVVLGGGTLNLGAHATTLKSLIMTGNGGVTGSAALTLTGEVVNSGGSRVLTLDTAGGATFNGSHMLLTDSTTAGTLTLAGAANVTINSVIADNGSAGTLNYAGTSTLTLTAPNIYTGFTSIDSGTVVMTVEQNLLGGLRFGSATSVTTTGTLDLTNVNATFGGALSVQTNSATANTITIGTGRTLTLGGNVTIGAATPGAANANARLTMTGGGSLVVNTAAGGTFAVGAGTSSTLSQNSVLDLTGLSSATINVSATGTVRVNQPNGTNLVGNQSSLLLPTPTTGVTPTTPVTTITAANFNVGDSGSNASAAGQVNSVVFGTGLTTLHVNTVNIGTGSRDLGQMTYAGGNGTLVLRAADGVGRAAFNLGSGTANTGVAPGAGVINLVDFTGHSVDLLLSTLTIGGQNRNASRTDVFSFDTGTLDATAVVVGTNAGTAGTAIASVWDSSLNLGGGTVTIGAGGLDIAHAPVAVTGADMLNGTVTISGGTVSIANNTTWGAAVRLSNSMLANSATANGSLIITGGSLTVAGHIIKGASTGPGTGTLTLNGGVLDMSGNQIGAAGALVSFQPQSGTLKNLAEVNGGGALVKTTAGTLIFDGTNTWSGMTDLQEGASIAVGGADNRLGTGALSLGSGTASATLQLGNAAGPSSQTVISLATTGTGTANAIVNGNAAFSTLTINQSINTTFNGALGGLGANQNNLHLLKTGAGELVIGGPATMAGTVTVSEGKLFFDGFVGASTTLTSLTLADGTEFSLRGSGSATNSVYNFSGTGNVITVGGGVGATLGFALDGAFNTQLNLAAGQTLTVNGTLTTAIYVNGTPNAGQQYVLINGADDGSIFASGSFSPNPVVFNGGSFTYSLSQITAGAGEKWVLTPSAQAAAADVWWKGDLDGIGTGVWSASTTSGTGIPTNWDTTQSGGTDALVPPDSGSIVHFSATGAANFATTLGANLTIQELIFHAGGTAISIGSSGGTNTLTLGNGTDPSGLTLLTGAPSVSFSANIALAQAQAWNIAAATSLTLSGGVSGAGPLSLNDNGTATGSIIISGAGGLLTHSGGTTLGGGWMILEGGADDRLPTTGSLVLGGASQGAILQLGDVTNGPSNTTIGSLSSGTSPDSSIFNGASAFSTLTVNQTNAGTFHGIVGGAGAEQNNLNLVKTGAAVLTLNNTNTYLGTTTVLEGTLRLGAAGGIAQSASLTLNANAGTTATFDINGRNVGLLGGITLGGADSLAMAQITDTAGGGTITLGGNIVYNPLNTPLGASITSHLNLGGASRTFTADDSTSATTDLTITGNITTNSGATTTGVGLVLTGTGTGMLTGSVTLTAGTNDGTTTDLTKNGTGTWSYQGALTSVDDLLVSGGTLTLLAGTTVVVDDVVNDNAGVILNVYGDGTNPTLVGNSGTSNGLYARSGAVINILSDNVTGTLMDFLILGDDGQGLGTLNLNDKTMFMPRIDLGFDAAGEMGVITGTGSITGLTTLNLHNGSISANLVGVGNIIKDNLTVTLSGNNALTGTTVVREGTLILDFTTNNGVDSKIGTGSLTMGATGLTDARSFLTFNGNASAASRQTVGGVTQLNGPAEINLVSNGGQDMVLSIGGALSRTNGTLNLNMPTAASRVEYTGTTQNTNGIVGAWLTVNNSAFATISGGQIIAMTSTAQNNAGLWTLQANVTNTGAGGYTGTVGVCNIISSLAFDAAAVSIVSVARTLYISSGGIIVSGNVGNNLSTITGGSISTGSTVGFIFHQNNTASTLTIASSLIGGSTILKSGDGVLVLSGTNVTGAVTIDEGTLRLAGGKALTDTAAVALRNISGAILEITAGAANSETIGSLSSGVGAQVTIGSGAVLTLNQTAAGTFSGIFTGAGGLTKTGAQVLTVTGNSSMTGPLVINQGRITLNGAAGALDNNNAYTLNGAEFLNVQDQSASFSRFADSVAMTLNNTAGTNGLWLQRTAANSTATENMGAITVGAGHNVVTVEPGAGTDTGTSTLADLLADNLSRTAANHATLLVRGLNLGATTTGARRGFIRFETAAQTAINNFEVGGGGAAGSTNMSIIPWLIGDITNTGLGSSLVTNIDNVTGLRPLALGEYVTNAAGFNALAGGVASNNNLRFDINPGAALTSTATAINSLVLDAAAPIALTGPGNGLEITSGTILAANVGNHSLGGFTSITTGGGRDYTVFVTGSATQNFTISSSLTSAVPLVKSGAGILTLTGTANAITDLYLNQGFVAANSLDKLGTGTINFFGGGLRLAAGWTGDLSTKIFNIGSGGGTLDVSLVAGGLTLTNGITDSTPGGDTLTIVTRSSTTAGMLTIQGASTFTGTTVFNHTAINSGTATSVLLQGTTNQAINGNIQIGSNGTLTTDLDVIVALGADEQIVDTASITFISSSGEEAYFKLFGRTETIAGISATARGVIENFESATDQVAANGKLILNSALDFSYTGYIRDRASGTGGTLSLEKQGTGTQTLAGAVITYTGDTTISGGTLRLTNTTAFNSNIINNATLDLNSTAGTWTLAKLISGTGTVVKTGTTTMVLSGANSYSGQTVVEAGVLSFSSSANLGDGSVTNSIRIANNATLQSTGADVDLGASRSITMEGNGGTVEVTGTGRLTASGALVGDECHTLTKVGDGALILSNIDNGTSFKGATQVNAGIVQVGSTGLGSTGTGSVIVGSGATLAGSGVVHGSTIINTGAVLQAGDVTTVGTAATTVTNTHTLNFTAAGTALTVQNGGQIRLGIGSTPTHVSTGVADAVSGGTYTNALAYIAANGTEFTTSWNIAPANATDMDFLNLTGAGSSLSIGDRVSGTFGDGAVLVSIVGGAQIGQVFNLIDWQALVAIAGDFDTGGSAIYDATGNVIAGDLDLGMLGAGLAWDVSAFSQYGILVVVPEPSRAVLLLCGLLGLLMRRRRR
ncbi:beta strand repeat-containing protein [Prosthecobacter sp.]